MRNFNISNRWGHGHFRRWPRAFAGPRLAPVWGRLMAVWFVAVGIALGAATAKAERFEIAGSSFELREVTAEVAVTLRSLRLNRAANQWNYEVVVSNRTSQAILGPLVLVIESFRGTSGPLLPDGRSVGLGSKPSYELQAQRDLEPGESTLARTLLLGTGIGVPELTTRVFAAGGVLSMPLAITRTLDDSGQPLPGVAVEVLGPLGAPARLSDARSGVISLSGVAGDRIATFSREGYLSVTRDFQRSVAELTVIPHPRLTRRSERVFPVTPLGGTVVSNVADTVQIRVESGVFSSATEVRLTTVDGQSLPGLLPLGWSPLSAFWWEPGLTPARALPASIRPTDLVSPEERAAWVRWNGLRFLWEVLETVPGQGTNGLTASVGAPGVYALVVADRGGLAPAAPVAGSPLPSSAARQPGILGLTASGIVNPVSSPASREAARVTAQATVTLRHESELLPSGTLVMGDVTEAYRLTDQSRRVTPAYEQYLVAYQRPGDDDLRTAQARFPMRPLLLFGAEELDEATVRMDVLPTGALRATVLDGRGGLVRATELRLVVGAGQLAEPTAFQVRPLDVSHLTNGLPGQVEVGSGFELTFDAGALSGTIQLQGVEAPPGSQFVLARVVDTGGVYGLEPVERLASDAAGQLRSVEPGTSPRLPGIGGSGQYALVRVSVPQALVRGEVRGVEGPVRAGLPVRLEGSPWIAFTDPQGAYTLVAPVGPVRLSVVDPATGNEGTAALTLDAAGGVADLSVSVRGPRVVNVSPAPGTSNVPPVVSIVIQLSKPINPGTLGTAGIELIDEAGRSVAAAVTLNLRNTSATLNPNSGLNLKTTYRVRVSPGLTDMAGLPLEGEREFSFTTQRPSTRDPAAQLIIYEPGATNIPPAVLAGIPAFTPGLERDAIVVRGTLGVADPEVPVVLVNESTAETSTVLSKPDGSFSSVIRGTAEDFVSATFVNLNGTRVYIPVSRQQFDNGFVGLYPQGGILEAQSDGGPVRVLIEPQAIETKMKLRLTPVTAAQLAELLGGVEPEAAKALAKPLLLEGDGQPMTGPIKVRFRVELTAAGYPTNANPADAAVALVRVTDTDGVKAFEVLDQLKFTPDSPAEVAARAGRKAGNSAPQVDSDQFVFGVVESVIGLVPQAGIANGVFRYFLMPILIGGKPITVKGRVLQSYEVTKLENPLQVDNPLLGGLQFDQLGRAFRPLDLAAQGINSVNQLTEDLTDLLQGQALGGAFVTLQNFFSPAVPGRLRPGVVYATSGRDGRYLMVAPTTPLLQLSPEDFYLIRALHPKFRDVQTEQLFALTDLSIAGVAFKNFVFRDPMPLSSPPQISVAHFPVFPAAGETVEIQVNAAQGFAGAPKVNVFIERVFPASETAASVQILDPKSVTVGSRTHWSGKIKATNTITEVQFRISAVTSSGTVHPRQPYNIRFDGAPAPDDGPIEVSDPTEKKGPSVIASLPDERGFVPDNGAITLVFNEPISRVVETNIAGIQLAGSTSVAVPAVRLSANQTALTIQYAGLVPDTEYVLTLSGASVMDLNGNPLDQRPSTPGADSFALNFRTPPAARFKIPGVVNGVGSAINGARLYVLDNASTPLLRTFDISNPGDPKELSSVRVVGVPRDLVVIPNYSYKLSIHEKTLTRDLVAVVGGNLDAILEALGGSRDAQGRAQGDNTIVKGQYLRVFDMADPVHPVELASPIISYRVGAAAAKVRWIPPNLVYQEFGPDLHQLGFVNLQEMLTGFSATRVQVDRFGEGNPGRDANNDGDYVDEGDVVPVPPRLPLEFFGKRESIVISGTTQRILDFSVAGGTVGVTLSSGVTLSQGGLPTKTPVPSQYRTLSLNGQDVAGDGSSVNFGYTAYPGKVTIIEALPVEFEGRLQTPVTALVSLSPDNLGRHRLIALDISLLATPRVIADIVLPEEITGGQLRSILRRADGLLELTTVSHVLLLDSILLAKPMPTGGQLHPAVVGYVPFAGGRMRSTGTSTFGIHAVAEGNRNEIIQTSPSLQFVRFPTAKEIVDPRFINQAETNLVELMRLAASADNLIPARVRSDHLGHASDLTPANPVVHYHVMIEAPGGSGSQIKLGLEGTGWSGWPLPNKGAGFPPVRAVTAETLEVLGTKLRPRCDAPIRALVAYRLSDDPNSDYYNRYLSRPFVVIYESVSLDDVDRLKLTADREILWSGAYLRAFIEPSELYNPIVGSFSAQVDTRRNVIRPVTTVTVRTLDVSYIMGPNPPPPGGETPLDGTYGSIVSHSGEFRTDAMDLSLPSPRMPIEIQRSIGGQDTYDGPFGLGWDFNYNQRLTELQPQLFPAGFKLPLIPRADLSDSVVGSSKDVLFHTGSGRIVLFRWISESMPAEYQADPLVAELNYARTVSDYFLPEPGVFDLLVKFKDGKFERLTPDGLRYQHAANGRLETIFDRFPANRHEMEYDRQGWLRRIDDRSVTTDRFVEFGYYRRAADPEFTTGLDEKTENGFLLGKICRVRDYAGRDVLYFYDDEGMLIRREGIEVAGENNGFSGRNHTGYVYEGCRIKGVTVGSAGIPLISAATKPGTGGVPVAQSGSGLGVSTEVDVPAENAAHKLANQKTTTKQSDGRVTEITVDKFGQPKVTRVSGTGTDPAELQQEHNEHGLVTFIQYPEGRIHRLTYDTNNPAYRSRGNLVRMIVEPGPRGGEGYTELHAYDARYNLPFGAQKDPNGFTRTFQLSPDGRFVRSVQHDAAGTETSEYDEHGQLLRQVDIDGIERSTTYDSHSAYILTTRRGEYATTYSYDGSVASQLGAAASMKPPRGAAVEIKYDRNLREVEVQRAASLKRMAYDEQGHLKFMMEAVGDGKQRTTQLEIDPKGFVTRRRVSGVEVNGTATDLEYVYTPDGLSRIASVLHPGGTLQKFTYNALGHPTKMELETYAEEYTTDRHGNVLEVKKGGDVVATTTYDGLDRARTISVLTGTQTHLSERTYFPGGELRTQKTTDPVFGVVEDRTVDQIDALGRVIRSTVAGDTVSRTDTITHQPLQRTSAGPNETLVREWNTAGYPVRSKSAILDSTITSDANGNVERVVRSEDGASYAESFAYDDLDHRTTVADNFGPVAQYKPRADGNNTEVRNARNNVAVMEHSSLGELLRRRRADGMEFRFRYDSQRQVSYSGDPAAGFEQEYDKLFRLSRRTQRNGSEIVTKSFDARNQPTSVLLPGGTLSMTYDLQSQRISSSVQFNTTTYQTTVQHDALNRVRVVDYEQSGSQANRVTYTHDKAGPLLKARFVEDGADFTVGYAYRNDFSRTRITYPSGYTVDEERDNSGRLLRIYSAVDDIVTVNVWQGNSRPKRVDFGGVLRMDNLYDSRGRLTGSRYVRTPGGALQAEMRYQHDGADNVEMRQFLHRAGKTDNYSYDTGERLVRAQVGGIPLEGGTDLSRLTYQRAYRYDTTGLDYLVTAPTTGPGVVTVPFAASWSAHDAFLLPSTVDGVSRGNPDSMGRVAQAQLWTRPVVGTVPVPIMAQLKHNALGQLVRIERADGVVVENFFQPGGLRYARKVSQGGAVIDHRHYVYDSAGHLLEEFDRTGPQPMVISRYFYMDSAVPCAADLPDSNGTLRRHYYLHDDQGSVVGVADRFGVVEERAWYDPFGQPVIEPRDDTAPIVKRVVAGPAGTLLIELTEPVSQVVFDLGAQSGIRRLTQSYSDLISQPAGRTELPEVVSGFAPYTVVVFTPDEPLSGSVNVTLRPGRLTDDWNNHLLEQTVSAVVTGKPGDVYYLAAGGVVTDSGTVTRSPVGSPFLFHGKYFDYYTGLIQAGARVYDPFAALFLEPDPAGYENSVNLYAALGNNPTSRTDPTGLSWIQVGPDQWQIIANEIIKGERAAGRNDEVLQSALAVQSNPRLVAEGSHGVAIQRGAKTHNGRIYQALLTSGAGARAQNSGAFQDLTDSAQESAESLRGHAERSGYSQFEDQKKASLSEFNTYFAEDFDDQGRPVKRPFAKMTHQDAADAHGRMVKNSNSQGSEIWYRFSIAKNGRFRTESLRIDEWGHLAMGRDDKSTADWISKGVPAVGFGEPPHFHLEMVDMGNISQHRKGWVQTKQFGADRKRSIGAAGFDPAHLKRTHNRFNKWSQGLTTKKVFYDAHH